MLLLAFIAVNNLILEFDLHATKYLKLISIQRKPNYWKGYFDEAINKMPKVFAPKHRLKLNTFFLT